MTAFVNFRVATVLPMSRVMNTGITNLRSAPFNGKQATLSLDCTVFAQSAQRKRP